MCQRRMILYTECSQLIPGGRGCRAREKGSGWGGGGGGGVENMMCGFGERWGYGG